jgi:GntP family gluconate:H+ symporter
MTVALSGGLYISHVMIPPTPGPIAAAGNVGLGDNLLLVIAIGALVSIPCLITGYLYSMYIGKKVKSQEDLDTEQVEDVEKAYDDFVKSYGKLPSTTLSFAPIIVPILLMALGSVAAILKWGGTWGDICIFLGKPIIALAGGVIFGFILLVITKRLDGFYEMTDDTLKVVGPILFVTAAGGVLGKVITEAGFVTYIKENATYLSSVGIFFPFIIAAILKVAQGSSTVAITTTSAIISGRSSILRASSVLTVS